MTIGIIGFGRFGKTLYKLLHDDFIVKIFDTDKHAFDGFKKRQNTIIAKNLAELYTSDVIFFAVPIHLFESIIATHKHYFEPRHLLVDVLSVKIHPEKIFMRHLHGLRTRILLTHPMFGPDSSASGFAGLPIIMNKGTSTQTEYAWWKQYFKQRKLTVIELSPRMHDKLAANSQGMTHFIGRLLNTLHLKKSPIDSLGTKKLHEIIAQTCNDTLELFHDLQHYNPYTARMRAKLGTAYETLYNSLLPSRVSEECLTIGIQGGKGSFNEEAVRHFISRSNVPDVKIKYLNTTKRVLTALHNGTIDRAQFAIHNSVGGIVDESIEAMGEFKFKIVEQFAIKISHTLMMRPDATLSDITTIMTHPQVLAQCHGSLLKKYPHLLQISGKGRLIDHALVAEGLGKKKFPKHVATMGSKVLAELYGLTVIEKDLQDSKENYTSFLQVERI